MSSTWHHRLWAVDGPDGALYRTLDLALAPAEWLYRAGIGLRSWAYDRNLISSADVPIPTLGIGNLTVGGTGKTPVAAWFARALADAGRRPAIVLRGYGGDEVRVHRILNPDVPVYPNPDRLAGLEEARSAGRELAVLDDVFQHRAVRVLSHVVLVAAEEWTERPRMLPRGAWREGPSALGRADLVVVTRKTAGQGAAAATLARIREMHPERTLAGAHIAIGGWARYDPAEARLSPLDRKDARGVAALGVAGVARPEAVHEQLRAFGVRVREFRAFPDHHHYDEREIAWIRRRAGGGPIVTTLKDAVKLAPALGADADLRVAIQTVEWETGEPAVNALLGALASVSHGDAARG